MKNRAVNYCLRHILALIPIIFMIGCSNPHDDLMDVIEGEVVLPSKSEFKLEDYARFYAYNSNGDVEILYTLPSLSETDYQRFKGEIEDYCADRKDRYPNCLLDYKKIFSQKAGNRYWLEDHDHLPIADDGGCSVIQFSFLKEDAKITQPKCNG